MAKQPSDDYSFHYHISIRNEYSRFAFMFYLFTILAFLATIFLFTYANSSYYNESESVQRRFIPYLVLGSISLALCFIFFLGSLVYTCKLIKKSRLKQTSNPFPASSDLTDNSNQITKSKLTQSFVMNNDESYYTSTKALAVQKSRTKTLTSHPYQTDV
jgi:hypothetical protein